MASRLKRLNPRTVIELGTGYASTTVNVCTFRHHAVVTASHYQFASFYESPTRIIMVRRDLRTDELVFGAIPGAFQVQDVHNVISIGVDPQGYLHVAYDHHNHPLRYRRSLRPLDVTAWTEPLGMTGRNEGQVCYPSFIMGPDAGEAASCFWFLYRHGGAGNGGICLKAYDAKTQTWHDLAHEFVTGHQLAPWSCSPYWNKAPFDSRGNLVLSWIWRVVQNASAGGDFIFNNNHVYVLQRSDITGQKLAMQRLAPPDYTPPGDLYILWDDEVNHCEPVADLSRWQKDGTLSLLVQAAEQPALVADREAEPTPVRLVDWVVGDAV